MYVSSYDRMDGTVQFDQIQQLQSQGLLDKDEHRGKKLFLEFLKYAGVSLEELLKQETFETYNALLQAASNKITDQILEYWTQNPDLSVEVKVAAGMPGDAPPFNAGTVARARIYNSLHRVDTVAELLGRPEADIEDLLAPALFVEVLNGTYALPAKHALTEKKLGEADLQTTRLGAVENQRELMTAAAR